MPKTLSKERMIENISIFDFNLDEEDMQIIKQISNNAFTICNHKDPKTINFLLNLKK
ncbi:hypothetical protein [Campylobacter canadensis]|uniref:hypothetical protein n=1 Tax=Campylobacter canadensis TaxID=449520 RepID=UPI001CCF9C49|nr:hypothetical protein [Campylobacter canadensis]